MSFKEQHANYKRPLKLCGIYKITNLDTQKIYIGKSTDIMRRFSEHKSKSEWKRNPNKALYKDMKKYGVDRFDFDVLELCESKSLNAQEKYWISYFNSNKDGYNRTNGGGHSDGEAHPNHKLSYEDIVDIRTRYANHERKYEVEERYKNKIGHSGFHKIWNGDTWNNVMPEVYTKENIAFHKNNTGCKGSKNGRALVDENQVIEIRKRKKCGEHWKDVYEDFSFTGISKMAFYDIWRNRKWKHVIV